MGAPECNAREARIRTQMGETSGQLTVSLPHTCTTRREKERERLTGLRFNRLHILLRLKRITSGRRGYMYTRRRRRRRRLFCSLPWAVGCIR